MNIPISYNWLRVHFEKDIPAPNEIATLLTKHLCEVEGMEVRNDDTIFDFKILPDRGHDLLSHHGIAREVSVLSGVPFKKIPTEYHSLLKKQKQFSRFRYQMRIFVHDIWVVLLKMWA